MCDQERLRARRNIEAYAGCKKRFGLHHGNCNLIGHQAREALNAAKDCTLRRNTIRQAPSVPWHRPGQQPFAIYGAPRAPQHKITSWWRRRSSAANERSFAANERSFSSNTRKVSRKKKSTRRCRHKKKRCQGMTIKGSRCKNLLGSNGSSFCKCHGRK